MTSVVELWIINCTAGGRQCSRFDHKEVHCQQSMWICIVLQLHEYVSINILCDCSAQVMCSAVSVDPINHCNNKNASAL